jgi:hypothetical protein
LETAGIEVSARGSNLFLLAKQQKATGTNLERWSVSENTLYGDPKVSVVTSQHRLLFFQSQSKAVLWNVSETGWEQDELKAAEAKKHGEFIMSYLDSIRGGLEPIKSVAGLRIVGKGQFQLLKKLGYLEEE